MHRIHSVMFVVLALLSFVIADPAPAKGLTAADKKMMMKPVPFLSFDQVAALETYQRVKYIHEMRQAYREVEKLQNVFGAGYALNEPNKESNKMYAIIFGQFAGAADAVTGGRGQAVTDQCIYAYRLSKYPKSGKLQPGECIPPASALCGGPGGEGVRCGFAASGIREDNDRGCVSKAIRYRATAQCDTIRNSLISENTANGSLTKAISEAAAKYGIGQADAKFTKEQLMSAEKLGALRELMNHAYDDKAYAYMMYVLSIYKKAGINIDFEKLDPVFKDYKLEDLVAEFNNNQVAMNKVFQDMDRHCSEDLTKSEEGKKVLAALRDPDYRRQVDKLAQAGNKFWNREKDRTQLIEAFDVQQRNASSGKPAEYTVRSLTEKEECHSLDARMTKIIAELTPISNTIADCTDCKPGGDNGEVTPPPPPKPEFVRKAMGCSRQVVSNEYLLAQPAAQCAICSAEKAVERSRGQGYTVSRKWMSFLSTMVLACGDGSEADEVVDPKTMAAYLDTFGHCSNDTYEWSFDDQDMHKDKIRQWATDKSYWAKSQSDKWWDNRWFHNKTPPPDQGNDFAKVYGIKYTTATKLFCNPDQFKTNWYGRLKSLKKNRGQQGISEFRKGSQEQFRKYKKTVKPDRDDEDSAANALLSCMDEGMGVTAGEKRRDDNGNLYTVKENKPGLVDDIYANNICVRYADVSTASNEQLTAFANDIDKGDSGTILSNVASCRVQTFNEESKDGVRGSGFEYPNRPNAYSRFGVTNVPLQDRPATLVLTHGRGNESKNPEQIRKSLIDAQAKTFSYLDPECRDTEASRARKKGKETGQSE